MPCYDARDDDQSAFYQRQNETLTDKNQHLEESLCRSNDIIMKLLRVLEENKIPIPENVKGINSIKKAHLKHRIEERDSFLNGLKREYNVYVRKKKAIKKSDGEVPTVLQDKIDSIHLEIERITNLTDCELLYDRDIF